MDLSIFSEQNFLTFIIPGFITVWTFRYFTDSRKSGDFEFIILSFIWGFIIFLFNGLTATQESLNKLFQNLFAIAVAFGFFGFVFGLIGAQISKWSWFRKVVRGLRSNWFKKSEANG